MHTLQATEYSEKEISLREYRKLKEMVHKLETIIALSQKAPCFIDISAEERLHSAEMLYQQDATIGISLLCQALGVPKGTLYNRLFRGKHDDTKAAQKRKKLQPLIEEIYRESKETYGAGRIAAVLQGQGVSVSQKLVADIMHENGTFSIRGGAKALYNQQRKIRENILQQKFTVTRPNEVWVSDVTYYHLGKRRYFICIILDLYARKIIAWKVDIKNSTQLTKSTFKAAYISREPHEGLIFHSDNGSNYICNTFSNYLKGTSNNLCKIRPITDQVIKKPQIQLKS